MYVKHNMLLIWNYCSLRTPARRLGNQNIRKEGAQTSIDRYVSYHI